METTMRRALLVLTSVLAVASAASAQSIVTTAFGQGEVIAVAVDQSSGTTYFASDRPGAIYKVTALTNHQTPTLVAGVSGGSTADGVQATQAAVFPGRNGLAIDAGGNLFYSEPSLHRIRRIDASTGVVTTIAGTGHAGRPDPRYTEGNNAVYNDLPAPGALAFNPVNGDLMVADEEWDIVYRLTTNGAGLIAGSNAIMHLFVGADGFNLTIYIDYNWYNPWGYAGDNGPAIDAKLNHPRGLAFDAGGNLYIADTGNHVIRKVDTAQTITTVAGNGTPGYGGSGVPATSSLFLPAGVAAVDGGLLIADTSNQRVRFLDQNTALISDFAGDGRASASDTSFAFPTGVAIYDADTVIVADSQNRDVVATVTSTDPDSPPVQFIFLASVGGPSDTGYNGDGAPGGDALNQPQGAIFDTAGNLFFSDSGNSRIRRVDAATHALTTVVGSGIPGYGGDGGRATNAMLNCPAGMSFGPVGELYIADPCASVVRKVTPGADGLIKGDADEIITTFAGTGIRYGNGPGTGGLATSAMLNDPELVSADSTGLVYIGEVSDQAIRYVGTDGLIQSYNTDLGTFTMTIDAQDNLVLAGGGISCGFNGIVNFGSLGVGPSYSAMTFDALGRLYLSDGVSQQSVLRLTPTSGPFCSATPSTIQSAWVAGNGGRSIGYSGDAGSATAATFNGPIGIAVAASGGLFISDSGNNVIRLVQQASVAVSLNRSSIDFGVQGLQSTTAPVIVTAASTGSKAATFGTSTLAGANAGDFTITSDGCAGNVIPVAGTCQVSVAFKPTATGQRSAILQINDDASGSPQTVALSGVGASLSVVPNAIAFGSQTLLVASTPTSVTVTNGATSPITVNTLSLGGPNVADYQISADTCSGVLLAAQGSCTFSVTFTPQALGSTSAMLTIPSSADARTVSLSGTGIAMVPAASVTPSSISFGNVVVGNSSTPATLTLRSTGTAPLLVSGLSMTGNQPSEFVLSSDTCSGATLAPGQACSVSVAFSPHVICSSTAAVSFGDNASDSPQTVLVSGQGTAGATGAFTATLFCTSHAAQPHEMAAGQDGAVWFDEGGSVYSPPAIARATAQAGVVSENPNVVSSGWHPSSLTFAPDGSYAYIEARGGSDSVWLDIINPAGLKLQSPTSFVGPLAVGPDAGFWLSRRFTCGDLPLVTDFSPKGVTTDVIASTGWIFAATGGHSCLAQSTSFLGPDGTLWIGSSRESADPIPTPPNGFVRVARDGTVLDFAATDAPPMAGAVGADGFAYALVANLGALSCSLERFDGLGHGTQITNPSIVSLGCFSLVVGPDRRLWMTAQGAFNGTTFPLELAAYDPNAGSWSVYPMPSIGATSIYLAAGPDEGIWFDAIPSAVGRFDIGGGPARAFVSPSIVSLPVTAPGVATAGQAITVRSTGTAPLNITNVTIAGADQADFGVINGCSGASLPPGSSCTILVAAQPTHPGTHQATLVISNNDGFSPQVVRLEEYVVPPPPSVSPPSVSFPQTNVGQHSTSVTVKLTNNGDRPLSVSYASLGGANSGDFNIVTDNCRGAVINSGGNCTVDVWFAPTAGGARSAALIFTDGANPPTQQISLSGSGHGTTGGGGGTTGDTCACAMAGPFVDPVVVDPANDLATANGTLASPNPSFSVTISGPPNKPTQFQFNKNRSPIGTVTVPVNATFDPIAVEDYGFSPDGNRFVVQYLLTGANNVSLYDLTSPTPATPVWTAQPIPVNVNPGGTAADPQGSIAFSPHGDYLVATVLQSQPNGASRLFMTLVSASGMVVHNPVPEWSPSTAPAATKAVHSAHWGFSPDDQTFAMVRDIGNGPQLDMISLPTGTLVQERTFPSPSWYAQFSPCGDVLGIVTDSGSSASAMLFSTNAADQNKGVVGQVVNNLPGDKQPTIFAGPVNFTVHVDGMPIVNVLAPNALAAGCPSPTTTGTGGGSNTPEAFTPISFTSEQPPLSVIAGDKYTYQFEAVGSPDPSFELAFGAPSWLSMDEDTGEVSGRPPDGTTTFSYAVTAKNDQDALTTGTFKVTVVPPNPPAPAGGAGGPYQADEDEPVGAAAPPVQSPTAPAATHPISIPAPSLLLLPNGRGRILLPSDVTPSPSVFTYTETDTPSGPLDSLTFVGLDFTFTATDAASGAAVMNLVDPPRAIIVMSANEMRTAHLSDPSRIGLYWWSGTAWINQMPCAGCAFDATTNTLTVALSRLGEYMLAAVPAPVPTLTITTTAIATTVNVPFGGAVATFAPGDVLDTLNQYVASVDWGDGQVSSGLISSNAGVFTVAAGHTWSAPGTYHVGITVFDLGRAQAVQSTAVVSPPQTPPQFTAANPPLTATQVTQYLYTFAASGTPTPTFSLATGAPSWLSIGVTSGVVTGTPPIGTTSFTYSVVASNGVSPDATAGPFAVAVSASTSNKSADLSVSISAPANAAKGSTVTYSIVVSNTGPSTATNGALVLLAGPNASFVSASPNLFINIDGLWTWTFANLDAGQSATFTLRLKLTKAGTVLATAAVGADTRDPKLANNAALVRTIVK